jgi:hypothetical protein
MRHAWLKWNGDGLWRTRQASAVETRVHSGHIHAANESTATVTFRGATTAPGQKHQTRQQRTTWPRRGATRVHHVRWCDVRVAMVVHVHVQFKRNVDWLARGSGRVVRCGELSSCGSSSQLEGQPNATTQHTVSDTYTHRGTCSRWMARQRNV